jgi:hypothetical protein
MPIVRDGGFKSVSVAETRAEYGDRRFICKAIPQFAALKALNRKLSMLGRQAFSRTHVMSLVGFVHPTNGKTLQALTTVPLAFLP